MSEVRRCQMALARMEELPVAEKELAQSIYLLIIKIELYHWSWPNSFGMLAVGLGALAAIISGMRLPVTGPLEMISIVGAIGLFYWIGFRLSKNLFFNQRVGELLHQMKNLQFSNAGFNKTLKTLKEIDPRIEVNIGKLLPQTY
ncbi:MAG: hypothetical protein Q8P76_00945 [bacterium]|nr:hypothetical protein [bacterium]